MGLSTLERLEQVEKQILEANQKLNGLEGLLQNTKGSLAQLGQMMITVAEQNQNTEEALANLAKTVSAIGDILVKKDVMNGMELLKQKQLNEDKEERRLIKALLESETIVPSKDPITPESMVVVSRTDLDAADPLRSDTVSDYLIVDLSSPMTKSTLRQDLVGRQVGDSVSYKKEGESVYSVLSVKETYSVKRLETLSEQT